MINRLTQLDETKAHFLWKQKKWDTLQIAEHIGIGRTGEHLVWRCLYEQRDKDRAMASALATAKKYGLAVMKAAP